jgi:hypothetical protein
LGIAKPTAIYRAENNIEVQMLCDHLERNGIASYVTTEDSIVGLWAFGLLPQIHTPKLWVDESNAEAARVLLAEYERDLLRRKAKVRVVDSNDSIQAECEDCGKATQFPESKRGTVQDCSHCGAYVDIGDASVDDWGVDADGSSGSENDS